MDEKKGGAHAMRERVAKNYACVKQCLAKQSSFDFCVQDEEARSENVITLRPVLSFFQSLDFEQKWSFLRELSALLEKENAAYDILGHRYSLPVLRFWSGPTIESSDLKQMMDWMIFSFDYLAGQWQSKEKGVKKSAIMGLAQ